MLGDRQPSAIRRIRRENARDGITQRRQTVTPPVDDSGRHRVTTGALHWMTAALALLAGTIFVVTDADGGRSRASIWMQLTLEVGLVVSGTLIVRRRLAAESETPLIMPLLVLVVVTSLLWEPFQRWFLLAGRPFEMMVMHTQKNLMLAAAVLGYQIGYQRLSVLAGVALTIFCAAIARQNLVLWLTAIYGFTAVSWMVAGYWDSLRGRLLSGQSRHIPLRWLIIGPCIPLLLLLASASGGQNAITVLRGILPGSGGDGGSDPYARSGANDGENLVAGTDNIKSFGPIEDAPFAEDDKPSLYDVFNDAFDEPVRKVRNQDRSIALPPELLADINARMARSAVGGREFTTLRKSTRPDQKRIKDLKSPALLYVAGRVPLHLRMEIYDVFDGVDWIPEKPLEHPPGMAIVPTHGKPWLRVPCGSRNLGLYTDLETHAVRIINLKSNVIPAPLELRAVHIDKVDQSDMYGWSQDSILKLNREFLPESITIHQSSECLQRSGLLHHSDLTFNAAGDRRRVQLPLLPQMSDVRNLAQQITRDVPDGFARVDAVINHLRLNYILDRTAVAPGTSELPVSHFLFEAKRGPDYQFATAAALMLRSLGFSTRVVSGFYASPEKYDPRKRHTPVHNADAHVWCEVYVGSSTWITLEPSPGYEILTPPPGFFARCLMALNVIWKWMLQHWLLSCTFTAMVIAGYLKRNQLQDRVLTAIWVLSASAAPRVRVLRTLQLLDSRLALCGLARPAGSTFSRWMKLLPDLSANTKHVTEFLRFVELAAYAEEAAFSSLGTQQINECCTAVVREISLSHGLTTAALIRAREKAAAMETDRSANFPMSPVDAIPNRASSSY
ncbi:MAG: transglutaminase-like domain-containing protein [Planctomycetaceae bacterium]